MLEAVPNARPPTLEDVFGDIGVREFECWSGSNHLLVHGDSAEVLPKLENLFQSLQSNSLIEVVVLDVPYGIGKGPWDTEEMGERWAQRILPKIFKSLLSTEGLRFLSPSCKFVIFHQPDNPNLWVCHLFFFFGSTCRPFRVICNCKSSPSAPLSGPRIPSRVPVPSS